MPTVSNTHAATAVSRALTKRRSTKITAEFRRRSLLVDQTTVLTHQTTVLTHQTTVLTHQTTVLVDQPTVLVDD